MTLTPTRLSAVAATLATLYGWPRLTPTGDPLGELVGTILSQSTTDANAARARTSLRAAFPTWEAVRDAPPLALATAIRAGGLGQIKAARIQAALGALTATLPPADGRDLAARFAAWLEPLPVPAALVALERLPGVGPKTAACVLLFALGRPAMPVDTHVFRVGTRLGFWPAATSVARAPAMLDAALPAALAYPLHILLIRHGRALCRAQRPRCDRCPLWDTCPFGQATWPERSGRGAVRSESDHL